MTRIYNGAFEKTAFDFVAFDVGYDQGSLYYEMLHTRREVVKLPEDLEEEEFIMMLIDEL